jgi:hypothetical protein
LSSQITDETLINNYRLIASLLIQSNRYISEVVVLIDPQIQYENCISYHISKTNAHNTFIGIINEESDVNYYTV